MATRSKEYPGAAELSPAGYFAKLVRDERDVCFPKFIALVSATMLPIGVAGLLTESPILFALQYALLLGGFGERFIMLLHNLCHRQVFKAEYRWIGGYVNWVLGPLLGQTPNTYAVHHVHMHHRENNGIDDLSSTVAFQRDSFFDFLRYYGRFQFRGLFDLALYLKGRGRFREARNIIIGEITFISIVGLSAILLSPRAAICVFVVPYFVMRFLMMAGNWAQHAFVDIRALDDPYLNTTTLLSPKFNKRTGNDGYHVEHHLHAGRHVFEYTEGYARAAEMYRQKKAVVFNEVDYIQVWFFLMTKQYKHLAKHFVRCDGAETQEEIIALLKDRTRRLEPPQK